MFLTMPAFALLGSTALLAIVVRHTLLRKNTDLDILPLPPLSEATTLYGHEKTVFDQHSNEMYLQWISVLGPFFKIKAAFFHEDIVVVGDNVAVSHILRHCYNYVCRDMIIGLLTFGSTESISSTALKSPILRPLIASFLGNGVFWAEGDDHKRQRRILAPAFSQEHVESMAATVIESAEKIRTRLESRVMNDDGYAIVNLYEQISSCTLDILGRIALGHDFELGQSVEAQEISNAWSKHVNIGLTCSGFIVPIIARILPWWVAKLPIPALHSQAQTTEVVNRLTKAIVEGDVVNDRGRDVLTLLRMANDDVRHQNRLNNEELVANITTLIVSACSMLIYHALSSNGVYGVASSYRMVGHETIANSVGFTLYALACNPGIQQRLRDEILSAEDLSYENIQQLEYLDAVTKEGLRIYPASPHTERINLKDDVIPLGKPVTTTEGHQITSYHAKAGTIFRIPFTAMNINPATWGEDAHIFRPERWMIPGGIPPPGELSHGWNGLATFCDGPRSCLGWRLALLEFKIIIAILLRSLEFNATAAEVKQMTSPTLQAVVDGKAGFLPMHVTLAQH